MHRGICVFFPYGVFNYNQFERWDEMTFTKYIILFKWLIERRLIRSSWKMMAAHAKALLNK
jgi:hypothetical protein